MNDTSPHASMRWPPSSATLARTALVCAVAALVACGDGIGRPIRVAPEGEGGAAGAGGSPLNLPQLPSVIVPGEPNGCALGDPNLQFAAVGHYGNFWVIDVANP